MESKISLERRTTTCVTKNILQRPTTSARSMTLARQGIPWSEIIAPFLGEVRNGNYNLIRFFLSRSLLVVMFPSTRRGPSYYEKGGFNTVGTERHRWTPLGQVMPLQCLRFASGDPGVYHSGSAEVSSTHVNVPTIAML
jgi:hypothetical protein